MVMPGSYSIPARTYSAWCVPLRKPGKPHSRRALCAPRNWLVNITDGQGRWTRNEHLGTPHVYNTRTAWAVLRMNQVEYGTERERVARANLDWAVSEQQPSGFFDECAFERGRAPFTHTIAYATRGLLESGDLLNDRRYIDAAQRCADAALGHVADDGLLPGQIAIDGKGDGQLLLPDRQLPVLHRVGEAVRSHRERGISARGHSRNGFRDALPGHSHRESERARRHQGLATRLGQICSAYFSQLAGEIFCGCNAAAQPLDERLKIPSRCNFCTEPNAQRADD
jgi:hypothetical protein